MPPHGGGAGWRRIGAGLVRAPRRWLRAARERVGRLGGRGRGGRIPGEAGQSTVEYTLIIALISVPLGLLVLALVRLLLRVVLTVILQDFTGGPGWT